MERIENNITAITGEVVSDFKFSHEIMGEGFYNVTVKVNRLSETSDILNVMVSDRLVDVTKDYIGKIVRVDGQFRSRNEFNGEKNRLVLLVFARDWQEIECEDARRINEIYLDGYICKAPTYRKTPLGREIADVLIAVNRPYGKSDYIPCVLWGRNARYTGELTVGTRVIVEGRIQSREYNKHIDDAIHTMTVYEVSSTKIDVVKESEG